MKSVAFLLLMLLLLPPGAALAAAPPSAVLILGEFSHWVELEYQYEGQRTKTEQTFTRTQHFFQERYNAQVAYAILDPRLLRGKLVAGAGLDQDYYSSSNTPSTSTYGSNFTYNLTGALLERSVFPLHFFAQSDLVHAQREFSNPYDIRFDTYGFFFALKNRRLPVKINFTRASSETSGLSADRVQDSNTFSLELAHMTENKVSGTTARFSFFDSDSRPKGSGDLALGTTYEFMLRNELHFPGSLGRSLTSNLLRREEARLQAGVRSEQKTLTLEEQLSWPLGKALTSGASYAFTNRETDLGVDRYHFGRAWMHHRLFESLTTELGTNFRRDDLVRGEEQTVAGSLGLTYNKRLPRESQVQLSFYQLYQVTERNLEAGQQLVSDEPHAAVADPVLPGTLAPIVLASDNVDPDSVVIRNADPASAHNLVPYQPVTDFTVEQIGPQSRIVIPPGSEIVAGDNLLISYSFLANPQVEYATTVRRVGFSLPLFSYAYRFYANWYQSQQDLLSGAADQVRLVDQTAYKVGFEANRALFSYGATYEAVDADQDRHSTVTGFVNSSRRVGDGLLAVYVSDAYSRSQQNSFTGPDSSEDTVNSFSAGGTYNTQFLAAAQMLVSAKYFKITGDAVERDDLSLGLSLRWSIGKITASLLSQVNWRLVPGNSSRDQFLRLNLSRYF